MNWKIKSSIFNMMNIMPFGDYTHYLMQKYVTRSIPRPDNVLEQYSERAGRIIKSYENNYSVIPEESVFFEFGAGRDLVLALALSHFKVSKIFSYDLNRFGELSLINKASGYLSNKLGFPQREFCSWDDLQSQTGIKYVAPGDARATGLEKESIDCSFSWNTMEHIPKNEIESILPELWRILKYDGLVIMNIDYRDHYARVDSTIHDYNFLQFTDKEWEKVENRFEHTNRLRHNDFVQLFHNAGFEIVIEDRLQPNIYPDFVGKLDARFEGYKIEDIFTPGCFFVLKKVQLS